MVDDGGRSRLSRLGVAATAALADWWPVPAMFVLVVAVQLVWSSSYQVSGHGADHRSSATVVFAVAFLVTVTVWALPAEVRRRPELWLLVVVIGAGAVLDAVGNVRVVDAIGADNWTNEQAELLGSARDGFVSGHDLAYVSSYAVSGSVVVLAVYLWRRKAITAGVAMAATSISILVPAWIFPGAGLVLVAVSVCVTRGNRLAGATSAPAG